MQLGLGAENCQQPLVLPWLLNEVACAAAHRLYGKANVAPGRHHDHRKAAVECDDLREQIKPLLA